MKVNFIPKEAIDFNYNFPQVKINKGHSYTLIGVNEKVYNPLERAGFLIRAIAKTCIVLGVGLAFKPIRESVKNDCKCFWNGRKNSPEYSKASNDKVSSFHKVINREKIIKSDPKKIQKTPIIHNNVNNYEIPKEILEMLPSGNYFCQVATTARSPSAEKMESSFREHVANCEKDLPIYFIYFTATGEEKKLRENQVIIDKISYPCLQLNVMLGKLTNPEINQERARKFQKEMKKHH